MYYHRVHHIKKRHSDSKVRKVFIGLIKNITAFAVFGLICWGVKMILDYNSIKIGDTVIWVALGAGLFLMVFVRWMLTGH